MDENEMGGGKKMDNENYVSKIPEEIRIMISIFAERRLRRRTTMTQSTPDWPTIVPFKDGALLNN